jgi:fibronectin type 3 domain-containing protein
LKRTPKPTPRPTPTPTPTPTPAGLTGVQTGKHVDLTWQASAGAVTYDVYRGTGSGLITLLAKGLTKAGYRDLAVSAGTSYSYQVSAIGAGGSGSRHSRIFTITIM